MNPCWTQFLTAWQDTNEEMFKKILLELNILKDCNHKRVVAFYGSYQYQRSQIRICMEYMDGGSLDKVIFPFSIFFTLFQVITRFGKLHESIIGAVAAAVVEGMTYIKVFYSILAFQQSLYLERTRYYPPRYQTVKYSLQHSRRHQTLRFRRLWSACQ